MAMLRQVLWVDLTISKPFFAVHSGRRTNPLRPEICWKGKEVCVCNSTYCDTLGQVDKIDDGQFVAFTSSVKGKRFEKTVGYYSKVRRAKHHITSMFMWGSWSYYSAEGTEYSICRVPIGGTDFSTRKYSYDDGEEDPTLERFALAEEDYKYRIPIYQQIMQMSVKPVRMVAAVWMKTNGDFVGYTFLKREHYDTYAKYTNLNVWESSWIDWNIALNMEGGPTWVGNYVDSPILVNAKTDEFYKQPMYYAMAHVSKFIQDGARRIDISSQLEYSGVYATAGRNHDGRILIIICNTRERTMTISIRVPKNAGWINLKMPSKSFTTVLPNR